MKIGIFASIFVTILILYYSNVYSIVVREVDTSTFSNYLEIRQTNIGLDLTIDFVNSVLIGKVSIDFICDKDYVDKVILDVWDLDIKRVENRLSGDSLEFFVHSDNQSEIGDFLAIKLQRRLLKGESLFLSIYYSTNKSSKSVQWLTPEMTYGKKYPYMFTQNEPIYARSMVPCQDTPSVKIPVKAALTLRNDLVALFGGLEDKPPVLNSDNTKTYFYKQPIPIPTYLIAIAAGNIDSRKVSDQVVVYSEPEFVDAVFKEFSKDTQKFIDKAVEYLFEYEWNKFNILVLPKAFPFGGMENPNLTFATPTLIAGDFSLTNVIAHELAHSWTGNLVTNSNWNNFWLNEGFTVFIERKINQIIFDDDTRKLNSQIGYNDLLKDIKLNFPPESESTSLYPNVSHHNPDDSFSNVPYEKGYNVLYFVERIIGEENFKLLLRKYLQKFSKKSVQFSDFKECFDEFIKDTFSPEEAKDIHSKVTWDLFIKERGVSELIKNDFTSKLATAALDFANAFVNNDIPSDFEEKFDKFISKQEELFLGEIYKNADKLNEDTYRYLTQKITEDKNFEIRFNMLMIKLLRLDKSCVPELKKFLDSTGRIKFIRPLYQGYIKLDKVDARKTFDELKGSYHPILVTMVEKVFAASEIKLSKE